MVCPHVSLKLIELNYEEGVTVLLDSTMPGVWCVLEDQCSRPHHTTPHHTAPHHTTPHCTTPQYNTPHPHRTLTMYTFWATPSDSANNDFSNERSKDDSPKPYCRQQ